MKQFAMIPVVVVVLSVALVACGGDDDPTIDLTADETSLASDGETQLHVDVSGSEETVLFETNLGGVGILPEPESEWTTSLGRADVPFACDGDEGTATVSATWVEEDLSTSIEIECG